MCVKNPYLHLIFFFLKFRHSAECCQPSISWAEISSRSPPQPSASLVRVLVMSEVTGNGITWNDPATGYSTSGRMQPKPTKWTNMCRFLKLHSKKPAFGKRNCVNLAPTQVADPTAMKVRQRAIISMKCECVHVINHALENYFRWQRSSKIIFSR